MLGRQCVFPQGPPGPPGTRIVEIMKTDDEQAQEDQSQVVLAAEAGKDSSKQIIHVGLEAEELPRLYTGDADGPAGEVEVVAYKGKALEVPD